MLLNNRAIIALIFIALENYIGTLSKALSELNENIDYEQFTKDDICIRLKKLIEFLDGDTQKIYKETNISNLIREFSTFRNEIFHDRRRNQRYHHTDFKSDIYKINIEDSIEALKIFINLCRLFSKSINGLNLMPNIIVSKHNTFYFERLDIFYNKLIKEYYMEILRKYNINTRAKLEINDYYVWEKHIYSCNDIFPIIKAKPDKNLLFDNETTHIDEILYKELTDNKIIGDDNFGVPNLYDN